MAEERLQALREYHMTLEDDLEEVVFANEEIRDVAISAGEMLELEKLGILMLRMESKYGAKLLAICLRWRSFGKAGS